MFVNVQVNMFIPLPFTVSATDSRTLDGSGEHTFSLVLEPQYIRGQLMHNDNLYSINALASTHMSVKALLLVIHI
jgi:hypothetical protein